MLFSLTARTFPTQAALSSSAPGDAKLQADAGAVLSSSAARDAKLQAEAGTVLSSSAPSDAKLISISAVQRASPAASPVVNASPKVLKGAITGSGNAVDKAEIKASRTYTD
jgi:hypothetical protein